MAPTIRAIANYRSHQEYAVDFFGDELIVTQTETPSVIRRWIHSILFNHRRYSSHPLVVGVGVQWTPNFHHSDSPPPERYDSPPPERYDSPPPERSYSRSPERYDSPSPERYDSPSPERSYSRSLERYDSPPPARYDPPADTLQLCVGKQCIIIQLTYCNRVPQILRRFLADSNNTFVGFWNPQDARKLQGCRHRLEIGELLDIRNHVKDSDGRSLSGRCSFEEMVEVCMGYQGVRLDHEVSTSDWSVGYLDFDQILQASVDAFVCFELGVRERLWELV